MCVGTLRTSIRSSVEGFNTFAAYFQKDDPPKGMSANITYQRRVTECSSRGIQCTISAHWEFAVVLFSVYILIM